MGERYPASEQLAGRLQGITHVAQEEEFRRRHAIGMRRNPALADVDFPIRKQLAQMVVGPSVAKPKLKYFSLHFPDKTSRQIEAGALRLQSADEAVEPTHNQSGCDAGAFA